MFSLYTDIFGLTCLTVVQELNFNNLYFMYNESSCTQLNKHIYSFSEMSCNVSSLVVY